MDCEARSGLLCELVQTLITSPKYTAQSIVLEIQPLDDLAIVSAQTVLLADRTRMYVPYLAAENFR